MKLSPSAVLRDDNHSSSLPMFSLDLDDDVSTSVDVAPFGSPPSREESYVGMRPSEEDGAAVGDAVRTRHDAFVRAVASLERTCVDFDSVDPSGQAAETSLRRRVGSLSMLCDALEGVASFVETSNHDLFTGEGLLAPFLAGVYLWAGDVAETLHALARDLNTLAPNWAAFRGRIHEVAWIHEMAVLEGRHLERVVDLLPRELHEPLAELMRAFVALKQKIDEPFG